MSTAGPAPVSDWPHNPWLHGVFAPVHDELTDVSLEVVGQLPDGLRGTFVRNGPNQQFPPLGRYHLFDGDGMLHGVRFDGEGGAAYTNRWIRTAGFEAERAAGRALFGGLSEFRMPPDDVAASVGPMKNTANTHVVRHAGRVLALMEGLGPVEVDERLGTVGPYDFDGRLRGAMTAHPKEDPETGELVFFGYSPFPPYVRVHAADRDGNLTWSTAVELPGPVMMHDFVITRSSVVLFDLPAVFDLDALLRGEPGITWQPDRGARVGVLPRGADGSEIRWVEVEPFWVFHFLNAHDLEDGAIEVVGCRAERLNTSFDGEVLGEGVPPHLHRWRLDVEKGTLDGTPIDDRATDFPRLDDRRAGLDHRYGYTAHAADWATDLAVFDGVVKYDLRTGAAEVHRYGTDTVCGETVFTPNPAGAAEDDGWLLSYVHDLAADRSSLVVLDASTLEEVARVLIPRRVPFGFHGSFLAAS